MNESMLPQQELPTWAELKTMILAHSEQMRETERQMRELNEDTKRQIKEMQEKTDRQMRDTDNRMKDLQGLFTTQWEKLVEALCRPAALKLFREKGIKIDQIYQEARHDKYLENEMEVDVILCNTTEAVAVEVKTTCKKKDVDYFLKKMRQFKKIFHRFEDCTVYPAIAALKFDNSSDIYALKKGLFVMRATGEGVFSLTEPKERECF
ncbi:MAG: hypothetical protein IKZ52_05390 [Bacteroidales bacterium]|nr:hypothetical protein [Bacteroidales bacterium]